MVLAGCSPRQPDPNLHVYEFANGRWYTGTEFEARTMYTVGAELRAKRPPRVDSVIDLGGGYVIPPFGEAHTHRPGSPDQFITSADRFLSAGIFYVMNHGSLVRYRGAFDSLGNRSGSIDARFSNALIVSPQSHGVDLWQRLVGRGVFPGASVDSLEGDAFFVVESPQELERKWPAVLDTRPDFIKIMVEYSEDYELRRDDPAYFGRSGLDPTLVPRIVALAHEAGLRVATHIETAADFQMVVDAGVDIVAHLPGYDIPEGDDIARYRIDPLVAGRAAEHGIVVITTTLLSVDRAEDEPARLRRMRANQRHNLRVLADAGVRLAVGSDQYSQHSVDEAINLLSLGVFDNATLLDMLCRITPQTIFPDRRVGVLQDGAEASFVVLEGDPLERLEAVYDIALRVKDGLLLEQDLP